MKKIICLALFYGLIFTTSAFAKCDSLDVDNSSVGHVYNPNTGNPYPDEYTFTFKRPCDKLYNSCSHSAELVIESGGHTTRDEMAWIIGAWYDAEVFVYGKNKAYHIEYYDRASASYCKTRTIKFD